jgi:hypothetical protein
MSSTTDLNVLDESSGFKSTLCPRLLAKIPDAPATPLLAEGVREEDLRSAFHKSGVGDSSMTFSELAHRQRPAAAASPTPSKSIRHGAPPKLEQDHAEFVGALLSKASQVASSLNLLDLSSAAKSLHPPPPTDAVEKYAAASAILLHFGSRPDAVRIVPPQFPLN